MSFIYEYFDFDDFDFDKLNNSTGSIFKDEVVDYIGGYIVKCVCSKLSCSECLESLKSRQFEGLNKSQNVGCRMVYPSNFVQKATKLPENNVH